MARRFVEQQYRRFLRQSRARSTRVAFSARQRFDRPVRELVTYARRVTHARPRRIVRAFGLHSHQGDGISSGRDDFTNGHAVDARLSSAGDHWTRRLAASRGARARPCRRCGSIRRPSVVCRRSRAAAWFFRRRWRPRSPRTSRVRKRAFDVAQYRTPADADRDRFRLDHRTAVQRRYRYKNDGHADERQQYADRQFRRRDDPAADRIGEGAKRRAQSAHAGNTRARPVPTIAARDVRNDEPDKSDQPRYSHAGGRQAATLTRGSPTARDPDRRRRCARARRPRATR